MWIGWQKRIFCSSRAPQLQLDDKLKARTCREDDWQEFGITSERKEAAQYRSQSFEAEIDGRTYQFIFVLCSQLNSRKERGIDK